MDHEPDWEQWAKLAMYLVDFALIGWMLWQLPTVRFTVQGLWNRLGAPERARRAREQVMNQMAWETHSVMVELEKDWQAGDLAERLELA